MTIGGALSDLNNLLSADDIPFYYKPAIKKVIETIEQEQQQQWMLYFDKLKEQINEQIGGSSHANSYDSGWDDALSEVLDMIDIILSEQE
jgi:hypothetical protein